MEFIEDRVILLLQIQILRPDIKRSVAISLRICLLSLGLQGLGGILVWNQLMTTSVLLLFWQAEVLDNLAYLMPGLGWTLTIVIYTTYSVNVYNVGKVN